MNIQIGARVKALRKRDEVTQEKLAEALGVTSQAISKWESGAGYPDIEYLTPIANFFNVTIDQLFDHDVSEKQRKIDEYCEKNDEMFRNWEPFEKRVAIMRRALAEFPSNEKLLVRLATALYWQWGSVNRARSNAGWEEPAKIYEALLSASVDDSIRAECREYLARIYAGIREKEKAEKTASACPDCKSRILYDAFSCIYEDDARVYSQQLLRQALSCLRRHLPLQTDDAGLKIQAIERLIDLYGFIFGNGELGAYNYELEPLYMDYAELFMQQGRIDEAFTALERAYEYAKAFDNYLYRLRRDGAVKYAAPFFDVSKDVSSEVYAKQQVPEFLYATLKNESGVFYKKLHDDPRYAALVKRIEKELAGS